MSLAAAIIMMFEGFMPEAYIDPVGIPTIGYGTIQYHDGTDVKLGDYMSEKTAEAYLTAHMAQDYIKIVEFSDKHGYDWNAYELSALVSFTYNVGFGNFVQLTGDGTRTKAEIAKKIPMYRKARGKVLNGLVRRRAVELCVFNSADDYEADKCLS